jgi:hypothetical protein
VALYCLGRGWIEMLRIDTAEHFFGLRLNVFTSIVLGLLAVAYMIWQRGRPREVIDRGATKATARPGKAARGPAAPVEAAAADGEVSERVAADQRRRGDPESDPDA